MEVNMNVHLRAISIIRTSDMNGFILALFKQFHFLFFVFKDLLLCNSNTLYMR